jgi:predicted ATPase
MAELASTGTTLLAPFFASCLARSLAACHQIDEARWAIQQAIVESDRTGQRFCDSELWRVRGELFLHGRQPDAAEAARSFERALFMARARGCRLWELRAATSLARLQADQGRRAEACDLLAPVCRWFTEGLEAADVRDARALLDELG